MEEDVKREIERLRACVIVDRAIFQALLEEMPNDLLARVSINLFSKFEQFTVKSLNSTMPDLFVEAQRERSDAWVAMLRQISDARIPPPK